MGGPHGGGLCAKTNLCQRWPAGTSQLYSSIKCLSPFTVYLAHFSTDFAEVETCFHLAAHLHVLLITAPLMQYVPQAPVLFVFLWLEPYGISGHDLAILRPLRRAAGVWGSL